MDFDVSTLDQLTAERLINSLIVPRPIAWVSSIDSRGIRNLAPFSYFTVASRVPPIVMISFARGKDTFANVAETGDFVINVVSENLARDMVASSAAHPPEIDEITLLNLATVPGVAVAAPRLAAARAALECTRHAIQEIGDSFLLFGEIRHLHIADALLQEGRVATALLAPVGRLGGADYCTADRPYRLEKPQDP